MPEHPTDPLLCPRCSGPKSYDEPLCASCAVDAEQHPIDDPPANDSGDEHYGAD